MGLTTCLSSLWQRKYLRVYVDNIASSRRTREPCWWRYFVKCMMIDSPVYDLLRYYAYCRFNGIYYYSFEKSYLRWLRTVDDIPSLKSSHMKFSNSAHALLVNRMFIKKSCIMWCIYIRSSESTQSRTSNNYFPLRISKASIHASDPT